MAVLALTAICSVDNVASQQLRVMTYNVRNGVGMDNKRDLSRVADVIYASRPDVVAIQEVDSVTRRSSGLYVLGELAAGTAMYPVYAPAIDYDGGKYGIGMLCRERPLSVSRFPLPGREEARALLVVEFPQYVVACTHLSLTADDALASTDIIRREAERHSKPFILMGDLNSEPGSATINSLQRDFRTLSPSGRPTWPADEPKDCIDYVMMANEPGVYVRRATVVADSVASDHRPIVVDMVLPAPSAELMWHAPYLQNVGPDGATVMYQTRRLCTSHVEFGTDTTQLRMARQLVGGQEVVHDLEHKVRLDGLTPGSVCYYRVRGREILTNQGYFKAFGNEFVTPFYSFVVPDTRSNNFTALIVNDLHGFGGTIEALSALARTTPHDMVIFNGDCLSEPASREGAVEEIHRLADAFGLAEKPALFIRGNHEIRNGYSSGMPSLFDRPDGKTYGAFTLGDIRFVTLDCGEDKPDTTWVYYGLNDFTGLRSEQLDFLKQELASGEFWKASRRVLIQHIPVWGNTDRYQPCTEMWAPVLSKAQFDLALGAHTHAFNVLPPQKGANPMTVVVGGAPALDKSTLMVLEKKGKSLQLRVLDHKGEELRRLQL